jgi:uncharacterized membrane protein HdeD (DUF308 family)
MSLDLNAAADLYRKALREQVKRHSLWYLAEGVLLTLAGVLAIVFPLISSTAIVLLLGWMLVFSGVVQALSLVGARHVPHVWLQLAAALLALVTGFLLLRDPLQSLLALTLLLLIFFLFQGVARIVFALTVRPMPLWGLVLASGIFGVMLAMLLLANLPGTAVWLIALMVGAQFIAVGIPLAWLAWTARQSA